MLLGLRIDRQYPVIFFTRRINMQTPSPRAALPVGFKLPFWSPKIVPEPTAHRAASLAPLATSLAPPILVWLVQEFVPAIQRLISWYLQRTTYGTVYFTSTVFNRCINAENSHRLVTPCGFMRIPPTPKKMPYLYRT